MATLKLKNIDSFCDRYGKDRYYYREGKGKRIPLQGEPGTDAFNDSYATAARKAKTSSHSQEKTFAALARVYYTTTRFRSLKASTQSAVTNEIERFVAQHGHRLVAQMTVQHVEMLVGAKAATPAAANTLLKIIRVLVRLAIRLQWIVSDPTTDVKKFKEGTFHTWTEAEISKYEKRWPLGSRERAAFDLHLYTGQRRGDVNAMSWFDIVGHTISVAQEKADAERKDEKLIIPIHSNLIASLSAIPKLGGRIITTKTGKPLTVESYGNQMAFAIEAAGLPARCVLHGLRKAAARRLAEAGCSASQIQAITGHKTLAEVERYVKAANQGILATQAVESLGKFRKA